MITITGLQEANAAIKGMAIRNKKYALVAERVQAFRKLCPDGLITTEILSMDGGVVTMKSSIYDEAGKLLATGLAQEKENSTNINKTSYVENCETSAVGRALAMLGIGSECSMASAEEVVNAQMNQAQAQEPDHSNEKCSEIELATLEAMAKKAFRVDDISKIFPTWPDLTKAQYVAAVEAIKEKTSGNKSKDNTANTSVSQ